MSGSGSKTNYKVAIRKNATGEVRICPEPFDWHEGSLYWYTDGNMGCDSNRELMWERAGGEGPWTTEHVCDGGMYTLLYAEFDDGNWITLDGSDDKGQNHGRDAQVEPNAFSP